MTCVCGASINPHRFDEIERHASCVSSTASTIPAPPDTAPEVADDDPTVVGHLNPSDLEDV